MANKYKLGLKNEDLLMSNQSVVMQRLKRNGICSRADIAKETGLTQAAVSKIISLLIDYGLVHETGFISGEKGRRSRGIKLNSENKKVIGIKLSRRSFSIGLFDIAGNNYDIYQEPMPETQSPEVSIKKIKKIVQDYIDRSKGIIAIGIAVPGPYLKKESRIAVMTRTTGWNYLNLQETFSSFGKIPVFIDHDAYAAAIAEWWAGKEERNADTLVYLLADEGIGAGIVVDGHILRGANGVAGEIGHISIDVRGKQCGCGNYGCLEEYCSSLATVQKAKEILKNYPGSSLNNHHDLTIQHIFEEAQKGDKIAVKITQDAGTYLGYGVVNLINAYDPSIIIIGNAMAGGGTLMMEAIKKVVKERIIEEVYRNIKIQYTEFTIDPVLVGAAAIATDKFLRKPLNFVEK